MPERRWSRTVAAVAGAAFAAPLAALVVQAFADGWRAPALLPQRWGLRGFDVAFDARAAEAFATSAGVAVAATLLALVVGWPAARVLGERRLRRPAVVFLVLALPLLVPPYATGFGLTEWFIRLGLAGSPAGLVAVHLVLVLPYVVLVLMGGFGPALTELEEMARSYGGPRRRLASVTWPTVAPALGTATLLGFLVSWSQYGSSLAVGAGKPMLPLVMFPYVRDDPQVASAFALLFLAPALIALGLVVRSRRSPL